nr:MAG TPA: hypothetical protein [Caudoviricetes sp.]
MPIKIAPRNLSGDSKGLLAHINMFIKNLMLHTESLTSVL